jgi:hypothetical protein
VSYWQTAPKWATALVRKHAPWATLYWRNRNRESSSGEAGRFVIRINAGTDRIGAKIVLLHEIAHARGPHYPPHGRDFFREAWRLWRAERIAPKYVFNREGRWDYGRMCMLVARELKIPGAYAFTRTKKRGARQRRWSIWLGNLDRGFAEAAAGALGYPAKNVFTADWNGNLRSRQMYDVFAARLALQAQLVAQAPAVQQPATQVADEHGIIAALDEISSVIEQFLVA